MRGRNGYLLAPRDLIRMNDVRAKLPLPFLATVVAWLPDAIPCPVWQAAWGGSWANCFTGNHVVAVATIRRCHCLLL